MDFSLIPNGTLFALMLALGMELELDDFRRVLDRVRLVAFGTTGQLFALPIVAYGIVVLLGLNESTAIGLMLIAACPGGSTSNVFTRFAGGDVALSISLTAISSMAAPITVPIVVSLGVRAISGGELVISVSALEMVTTLFMLTIVPVVLGMVWRYWRPVSAGKFRQPLLIVASVILLLLIIGLGFNTSREVDDVAELFQRAMPAVLLLIAGSSLFALVAGLLVKATTSQVRTLVLEVGVQNVNLALVVALQFLESPQYLGATLVYLPVMLLFAAIVIGSKLIWKS